MGVQGAAPLRAVPDAPRAERAVRVMLVDDSMVVRRLLRDALMHGGGVDVVAVASTGSTALGQIPQAHPDVVLLDVEMPGLDGLATLEQIRERWPSLPVVMVSGHTPHGSAAAARALELGADDVYCKPTGAGSRAAALAEVVERLVPIVRGWGRRRRRVVPRPPVLPPEAAPAPTARAPRPRGERSPEVVLVGVSTGGPVALGEVLPHLPADLPVPVVVVQHMPAFFTRSFAERLDARCPLHVVESEDRMRVEPGHVYIAAGGSHTWVQRTASGAVVLRHAETAPVNSCRPSVDVLLASAEAVWGGRAVTVMLTGMGHDGLDGTRGLHALGAHVIAQDQASSVVWGMPGAVVADGLAHEVLPLDRIGEAVVEAVTRPRVLRPRGADVRPAAVAV